MHKLSADAGMSIAPCSCMLQKSDSPHNIKTF